MDDTPGVDIVRETDSLRDEVSLSVVEEPVGRADATDERNIDSPRVEGRKVSSGITYPPMRISKWPRIHASQALSLGVLLFTRPRMVVEEYNYTYLSQCLPHSPFINLYKLHDVGNLMMRG